MKLAKSLHVPLHRWDQWFCPGNARNDALMEGILGELIGPCLQIVLNWIAVHVQLTMSPHHMAHLETPIYQCTCSVIKDIAFK